MSHFREFLRLQSVNLITTLFQTLTRILLYFACDTDQASNKSNDVVYLADQIHNLALQLQRSNFRQKIHLGIALNHKGAMGIKNVLTFP